MNTRSDIESPCPDCGHPTEEAVECGMDVVFWQCEKCGCQKAECKHSPETTSTENGYETRCGWCGLLLGED